MRRAAIVSPVRTAVGAFGGSLLPVEAVELAATVLRALVTRSGIDAGRIEDVIFGQGYPNGEAPCIGRFAALQAGFPVTVPGAQIDRRCGSGLSAIATAAMMVQSGAADVVVAGGVESMSRVEYYTNDMRWGARAGSVKFHDRLERGRERSQPLARFGPISGMIETAENLAAKYHISREEADAYALRSHQRAAAAWRAGRFDEELVPVTVPQKKGVELVFAKDEGVRPQTSLESLAKLQPIMKDVKDAIVTAGNSAQQNDAAAVCLVVAEDKLKELQLEPMAYLVDWAVVGCEPAFMGIGPVPAMEKIFRRTGLSLDQMDLVEINEAFACQVLAVCQVLGWHDADRLNVNGSGISLGHPIGATGGRILASLLHEMKRRQSRYGLETMCIGGGQGIAAIFERA
jgi:acetyl-CoA C-acetyltransferase